jgi:outer membrane protein
MKRIAILAVMAMIFFVTHAAAAENLKIGGVNFQQALNEVEQGRRAKAALKSEFDAKQKKLDLQQAELKKMQEEIEKQKSVLSQDALAAKQKTFGDKYLELQKSMASYRDELVAKEAKMTGQILKNLKTVVAEVGQKEGFTLIVETSQDAVLYAQVKEDLTTKVVSLYNQRYSGPIKME